MGKKHILVIEDEQIVAYDLRILLTRLGHIPLGPATSGPEAIEMAARTRPDLILMDVQLDGPMDGVETSAEIVKNRPVPIVYLTAYPGTFVRNPYSMVSPFLCAAKPFSAEGLEAIINRALGISTARPN
jgi:CheY-like chemotaxis protein